MNRDMVDGRRGTEEPLRKGNDPPAATARDGWRYHHIGIPTQTPRPDEIHIPRLHIHVSAYETSACGVQWMRFDADAPYPEIIKTIAHVAFEVDNLEAALAGQEILIPPNSPSEGVRVAMILDHGAPVELLEFASKGKLQPH
jgi:hypothetical protein